MPFLYPEAALMLVEHAGLSSGESDAILERNWQASPVLAGLARLASDTAILSPAPKQEDDRAEQR
jgi:hypothetical protein